MRSSANQPPAEAETHIWRVPLNAKASAAERFASLFSPAETRRAAKFRFQHLRHGYILAHGALRRILSGYCGAAPQQLRFDPGRFGKPYLSDPPDRLCFNLSHCADLALVAVTSGARVGVDVETSARRLNELELVIDRYFGGEERAFIEAAGPARRMQAFCTLWTRREAVAKALGLDLGAAVKGFDIPVYAAGQSTVCPALPAGEEGEAPGGAWLLQDLTLDSGHIAAVCVQGKKSEIVLREFIF